MLHCAAQADAHRVIEAPDDREWRTDILNGVSLILEDTHAELEAAYDAMSNEPEKIGAPR